MFLQWNENLASGSGDIDNQHRELFSRVNTMLRAFTENSAGREEISRIVQFLNDYVVFHFETEEKQMDNYSYSSKVQHRAQHEQFVKIFLKLRERLLMEGISPGLAEDMKSLVVDWLLNHIKYSDRALGMFLKMKK